MNNEIEELNLEPVRAWLKSRNNDDELIEILLDPDNIDQTLNLYVEDTQWKKKL